MKRKIQPEDIRIGDLIRHERPEERSPVYAAVEFRVMEEDDYYSHEGAYYLLDRPAPEPWDGMRIQRDEHNNNSVGVRIDGRWLVYDPESPDSRWRGDDWYRGKLDQGWEIVDDGQ